MSFLYVLDPHKNVDGSTTCKLRQLLLTDGHEDLVDIHGGLSGCLHEQQAVVVCVRLCFLRRRVWKSETCLSIPSSSSWLPLSRKCRHAHTWKSTALLLARSALFPARAMTMLGLACLWSSFTQFFARVKVSWNSTR